MSKKICAILLLCASHLTFAAGGTPRLEVDFKLDVPTVKKSDFLGYLHKKFDQKAAIKLDSQNLLTTYGEEDFTDTYYDDDKKALLKQQAGLRYRKRVNLTDPKNKKNGRELVQLKIDTEDAALRQEYKFKPEHPQNPKDLFQSLNPTDQKTLKEVLSSIKSNTAKIQNVLTIKQKRHRFMLQKADHTPIMTMTLDECTASTQENKTAKFLELEIEINEKTFTDASKTQRDQFYTFATKIKTEVLKDNPYLSVDQTPKYNKAYNLLHKTGVIATQ